MSVAVIVPFSSADPWRVRARGHVARWWMAAGFELVEGSCAGSWRKAVAVDDAVSRTGADILVVADADVLPIDSFVVDAAVAVVEQGAAWVMPHAKVHRLDQASTRQVFAGMHPAETTGRIQSPYTGWSGGGLVVLARHTWEAVPMDPRFEGWSGEDESWAHALTVLAGPLVRFDSPLFHLFHPPAPRISRRWGSQAARALARRYSTARYEPDTMRRLVDDARAALRVAA